MVDYISKIQHLLAESKFVEAQKEAEFVFNHKNGSESTELIQLYFESLKAQSRPLPTELLLSLAERLFTQNIDEAQTWLEQLNQITKLDQQRVLLIKIKIAEAKGRTEELYNLVSQYQIIRFENCCPQVPAFVDIIIDHYFVSNFQIQLQRLTLDLMRMDLKSSEVLIQKLVLSCFERSSPRGTKEKLNSLYEVLSMAEKLYHLDVYKSFCSFMSQGVSNKKEFKKLIELVIYMDDFKFQAILLNFMVSEGMNDAATDYAADIRLNEAYSYVYFDKFFPHLKKLFFQKKEVSKKPEPKAEVTDLKVSKTAPVPFLDEPRVDISEEEVLLAHMLKHQKYSTKELLDVAVSFVQSEFYHAAFTTAQLAFDSTERNDLRLKAYYLKITCLLKTGDYRSALDLSLDALSLSETQNDVLSFMYSQAEAHLRLKEYASARSTLKKILSIDSDYRLAKERLDRLNAI